MILRGFFFESFGGRQLMKITSPLSLLMVWKSNLTPVHCPLFGMMSEKPHRHNLSQKDTFTLTLKETLRKQHTQKQINKPAQTHTHTQSYSFILSHTNISKSTNTNRKKFSVKIQRFQKHTDKDLLTQSA